jgi:quinoprotein relay system zinc metallohydrolase 2
MFLLTACLAAAPDDCAPRLLPAGDAPDAAGCEARAEPIARDWIARHPDLRAREGHCVPTGALPALNVTEIADDVYFHQGVMDQISPGNRGRIANLAFVIGDTVAVIDAGGSRAEGEALYAAIRRVTDRPISHLILTHMHPDHILGAEVFSEAGATITANARLPEALARRADAWMVSIPAQIGRPAFAGTRVVAPDRLVAAPATIALGPTQLQLVPVPSAHTDNDLTVQDSRSGVFFAGDLVFRGLTPSLDGRLAGWLDWTRAGPPRPVPSLIVPGHGPVTEIWADAVTPEQTYLTGLRDATRRAIRGGMALSRAIPAITAMMQPYSEGWADFDATTARNAATAYSQLEWE